jgi:hypothetical protein
MPCQIRASGGCHGHQKRKGSDPAAGGADQAENGLAQGDRVRRRVEAAGEADDDRQRCRHRWR